MGFQIAFVQVNDVEHDAEGRWPIDTTAARIDWLAITSIVLIALTLLLYPRSEK